MIVHPADPSKDPHDEIRTDLWDTMSLTQLHRQQELMINRLNTISRMMSSTTGTPQTVIDMYAAVHKANAALNAFVETKSQGNVNA